MCILSVLANVALDWLFCVPLGLGVGGAAWATVISQGINTMGFVYFMTKRGTLNFALQWPTFSEIKPQILFGLPIMFVTGSTLSMYACMQWYVSATQGVIYGAAHKVLIGLK